MWSGGEAYGDFSYVYDELMDGTPYGEWCSLIADLIERYGVSKPDRSEKDVLLSERNLVVDLGCGTGTLTELLYEKGYDMIGVDNSESMLAVAMEKRQKSGSEILYLCQDMRELELYSTVGTVVSVCDSLNYILEEEELLQVFSLVNNYLIFHKGQRHGEVLLSYEGSTYVLLDLHISAHRPAHFLQTHSPLEAEEIQPLPECSCRTQSMYR